MHAIKTQTDLASFRPGEVWLDTANQPINAHGGGVVHHDGVYYWFGVHKIGGAAGNFESPIPSDTPGSPSVVRGSSENPLLPDAARAALRVLSQNPDGFFLMVEQGDVDWANHANDFARMIGCMWDLHQAVQAIVDFVDTPGDAIDWDNTTLIVTADHANSYLRLDKTLGMGDLPTQLNDNGAFSYPDADISYGTTQHTGELVTLHARGFAAERVLTHATPYPGLPIIDNTAIYELTLEAAER